MVSDYSDEPTHEELLASHAAVSSLTPGFCPAPSQKSARSAGTPVVIYCRDSGGDEQDRGVTRPANRCILDSMF